MIDHTPVLSGALVDYTDWLQKQKGNMAGSPNELRGIFYNKLINRLREIYSGPDLRSAVTVEDMIVTFSPPGYITGLSFCGALSISRPNYRNQILEGLQVALLSTDVNDCHDKVSYELSKVILDLKKSLNYGRQQTTG